MSSKRSVAVVGGGVGGKLSIDAVNASAKFELAAITDMRPEVCESWRAKLPGVRVFTDHNEMFRECPTDIVCVSTFPPSHEPITMDALNALPLKGILVEKPLGHTAASGRAILNAIKKRGIPMAVPHNMLVRKGTVEVLKRVRAGEIGELRSVTVQSDKWDIMNAGIHWFNYFVALTDREPIDHVMCLCEAGTRTYRDGMQVETTAVASAVTKSGVQCILNTGDSIHTDPEITGGAPFRIVGSRGQIAVGSWSNSYFIQNREHPEGTVIDAGSYSESGHQRHLETMADLIGGTPDYAIPESSLMALELVEASYLSSKHHCKVTFPFADFVPPTPVVWEPGTPYSGTGGGRDGRKL
ncbi:MAG: Gfo/Idh/MocA family oxidoreductase [Spirochaetes bacterium]|nr:Gfo/Idh/MocA family oxidoreductase [Spirochaetota bacterium]